MPTNKHAVLRFNVIDKCLSNTGRNWTFVDLKNAIEDRLSEIDPASSGISIRSVRNDLEFMRSDDGYSAPIESFRIGRKHYYRYMNPSYSINQKPLSQTDAVKLKEAISILQRFEGSPEFEWIEDVALILKDHFDLESNEKKILGHDNDMNISYSGYHLITPIFNAIKNKRVLQIHFESFKGERYEFYFHPYYLKQYNKRWFLFGFHVNENNPHWNIPLDRISSAQEVDLPYHENFTDWGQYFSDIVGVTVPETESIQDVVLRFNKERAPYVITKPIHDSQKQPVYNEDGTVDIKIRVIPNKELVSKIMSFGGSVEVLEPLVLRNKIIDSLNKLIRKYNSDL